MADIGNALLKTFAEHTEATQAFEPWWDTTKEFLVYGLIMIGKANV